MPPKYKKEGEIMDILEMIKNAQAPEIVVEENDNFNRVIGNLHNIMEPYLPHEQSRISVVPRESILTTGYMTLEKL